ncbi:hypothetical protein ACFL21_05340, partial [Patescibacteria group bacterium]
LKYIARWCNEEPDINVVIEYLEGIAALGCPESFKGIEFLLYELEPSLIRVNEAIANIKALGVSDEDIFLYVEEYISRCHVLEVGFYEISELVKEFLLEWPDADLYAVVDIYKSYDRDIKKTKEIYEYYLLIDGSSVESLNYFVNSFENSTLDDFHEFEKKLKQECPDLQNASILWLLTEGDMKKAKTLHKSEELYSRSLVKADPKDAIPFLMDVQNPYNTPENILDWYAVANSLEEADELLYLEQNYLFGLWTKDRDERYSFGRLMLKIKELSEGNDDLINYFRDKLNEEDGEIEYINLLFEDPALAISVEFLKTFNDEALAFKTGRNFYLNGGTLDEAKELSKEEIFKLEEDIEDLREEYGDVEIFKDRNVVLFRNPEKWDNGADRFFPWIMQSGFQTSMGLTLVDHMDEDEMEKRFQVYGPEEGASDEETLEAKEDFLKSIAETEPPLFMGFSGHGEANSLSLENDSSVVITPTDLAEAIVEREKNFPGKEDELSKDIYFFSACFNFNFILNTLEEIDRLGGICPIMMGESEYGKVSYSHTDISDESIYKVLGLGKRNVKIEDIDEENYSMADFTVFVPSKEGRPQHIVKDEGEEGLDKAA